MGNPIFVGALLAILAAASFGLATPFIQRFGDGVGPFTTACALYLGAAFGALPLPFRRRDESAEPGVGRAHLPRLFLVAVFGAALAPTLFAWGLQRVPASTASLLLNFEAVFTLVLAVVFYREHIGGRVALAAALMTLGGAIAFLGSMSGPAGGALGASAVIAGVLCWALDNVLTRPLSGLAPASVVRGKALIGVLLTGGLALLRGEGAPPLLHALGLLVCGATGYGLSLRFYLLAQRRIGAARTGSVFAVTPFLGVAAAVLLGDRSSGWTTIVAGLLFAAGVVLHLTEQHAHTHAHEPLEHEHAHRHDDGHHGHFHEVAPSGAHSHPHRHEAETHDHPHGLDVHHEHGHG